MRDTIYTIPLNDVFAPKSGCPVCRLREMLERRCTEYIMGAAMMEPDIRIETNRCGFCPEHLDQLVSQKNRLSLALMLETHLDELLEKHMPAKRRKGEVSPAETCFVCKEVDGALEKMLGNIAATYIADPAFRELFYAQERYCFRHYDALCARAGEVLPKKQAAVFLTEFSAWMRERTAALRKDVHEFTTLFDYRSAGKPEEERLTSAVPRAVEFLK
jgi:hypothetical protein